MRCLYVYTLSGPVIVKSAFILRDFENLKHRPSRLRENLRLKGWLSHCSSLKEGIEHHNYNILLGESPVDEMLLPSNSPC